MIKEFLQLSIAKTQSDEFRQFLEMLLKRCSEHEALCDQVFKGLAENRARREGKDPERIKQRAKKSAKAFAVQPEEAAKFKKQNEQIVRDTKTDERLLELMLHAQGPVRRLAEAMVKTKGLAAGDRALFQKQLDFIDESNRLMLEFAAKMAWPIRLTR